MAEDERNPVLLTDEVRTLLALIKDTDIAEVLIERGDAKLHIKRAFAQPVVAAAPTYVAAPMPTVPPVVAPNGSVSAPAALEQPVLGICLGMQLLFDRSDEEDVRCLGIIPGEVRKLVPERTMPVPHMGWSRLTVADSSLGLRDGDYVYFAHSYACDDGPHSIATAQYGRPIPAAVKRGNYHGAQFHPERSGEAGARFLESFLAA